MNEYITIDIKCSDPQIRNEITTYIIKNAQEYIDKFFEKDVHIYISEKYDHEYSSHTITPNRRI